MNCFKNTKMKFDSNDLDIYIFLFFVCIGFITSTIISLIYGIFALIPVSPFVIQNLPIGITLILLSVFGIMGIPGTFLGAFVGGFITYPFSIKSKFQI